MKPPFQKDRRKLDLERLEDWPRALREKESDEKEKIVECCPYCSSKKIVKRGVRKKKLETIQRYLCTDCDKTFVSQKIRGKQFPLKLIFDGLSCYNMGYSLDESCSLLKEQYGMDVNSQTLSNWLKEFEKICTYARMRDYGSKMFTPAQIIQSTVLYHRQVYKFRYHRAKTALLLQEFMHSRFAPLASFLDAVSTECPHQLFQEGERSSQQKEIFDLSQVRITEKQNFAVRLAQLVLQAVNDNRQRHETLQKFMLANDSATVATEVPVWIDNDDLEHFRNVLGFDVPLHPEKVITGHIDFVQIRNRSIHILDYKPNARKEWPIEQLTVYALALSRLTGLRLFEMKCAWFDDKNYYEFFPLHVVYKKKKVKIPKEQLRLSAIDDGQLRRETIQQQAGAGINNTGCDLGVVQHRQGGGKNVMG